MNSTEENFDNRRIVVAGLFLHNIKIAFRNLWKYKSHTLINIAGLATGLTCFALSLLWIHYEMSFDGKHKNTDQLYVIFGHNPGYKPEIGKSNPAPFAAYLKETLPEIKNAAPIFPGSTGYIGTYVTMDEVEVPASTFAVDSNFFRIFDLKLLAGSRDFLKTGSHKMAITQEKAQQLFGNKNPIGTQISMRVDTFTICAVITGMPKPSNYMFDFIRPLNEFETQSWNLRGANIIIELFPETDVEIFNKKLREHKSTIGNPSAPGFGNKFLMPLKKMRYNDPSIERNVNLQDIIIFSIAGLLVVLCSLFNYFISMACRFHIRQKEFALRLVFGASGRSMLAMLMVEFLLSLLFAVGLGMLFTQLFFEPFLTLSNIQMNLSSVYRESSFYLGAVILVALLFFSLILLLFRKRNLTTSIRRSDKKLFQKISIVVQLVISIVFVFCTIIIQKQMYFLHHSHELGFSFQNRGLLLNIPRENSEVLANQLRQLPEITEVIEEKGMSGIFPHSFRTGDFPGIPWDNKSDEVENFRIRTYYVSPELIDFYDFRLMAGEMLTASDPESFVLINEDAAKAYGWSDPVGKQIVGIGSLYGIGNNTVKGVVKNVYIYGPIQQIPPSAYLLGKLPQPLRSSVFFKYREGMWKSCKEKIDRLIETEYADLKQANSRYKSFTLQNFEEEYNKLLKSEIALQKLFSLFSAICVLICVFGFVSIVSLSCKERRKSIAIRKINGATPGDILSIFAKEYTWLLMIGAIIAFPTGYFFMQRWLEHYIKQTDVPVWIYLSILFVIAFVVVLCVGYQVYKASIENPSEVVKSE